jgi:hypothetical protein
MVWNFPASSIFKESFSCNWFKDKLKKEKFSLGLVQDIGVYTVLLENINNKYRCIS